jgi:hypothetical protein
MPRFSELRKLGAEFSSLPYAMVRETSFSLNLDLTSERSTPHFDMEEKFHLSSKRT